ncbi:MAG TPA: ABC transporter permease [Gaiellaceae bacterium]|jgi:ABC-2 type transport system permease protein|nr:ABC transporter permease [Gaiellaceae bacterium]
MRVARLLAVCWWFQLKQMTKAGLFVFTSIIEPLIFATLAYYLFKAGHRPGTLLYAALSAGLMGIWTSTLFGAGGAINFQRWQGVLEPLIASPPPYALILFPQTLAAASIGLYSLASTLLWGRLVFGIPLHFVHPVAFVVAVFVTILSLGVLGLVMGASFILYREANALANMLEFPIWIVTGVIVPLSLLPGWIHPLSWILAPTWGYRGIHDAALGGNPWPGVGMAVGLAAVYFVIGQAVVVAFERRARERATLSLV